jgi:2-polyprenyl-6-hydroxyphenyl methylase/3-demethylubiquinone-9 3-methyltransferase
MNREGYYSEKLSAERLRRCYEIAPAPIQHYLCAEIEFVLERVAHGDYVLDLGCGYGRVMPALAERAAWVVGVDTSPGSLAMAAGLVPAPVCRLARMSAERLGFVGRAFDLVLCIQNGISAFKVDARALIDEAVRVTRPGGRVLLSTYAPQIWEARLEWFRAQAAEGLVGEIDETATGGGVIVCKDDFTARTVSEEEFTSLTAHLQTRPTIHEVAESSVFCEIHV